MKLSELNFMSKERNATRVAQNDDVAITKITNDCLSFSLSDRAYAFLQRPQYVVGAFVDGKVYLKSENAEHGYKISTVKQSKRFYFRFPGKLLSGVNGFSGRYNLSYDQECGLAFIDLRQKKR